MVAVPGGTILSFVSGFPPAPSPFFQEAPSRVSSICHRSIIYSERLSRRSRAARSFLSARAQGLGTAHRCCFSRESDASDQESPGARTGWDRRIGSDHLRDNDVRQT